MTISVGGTLTAGANDRCHFQVVSILGSRRNNGTANTTRCGRPPPPFPFSGRTVASVVSLPQIIRNPLPHLQYRNAARKSATVVATTERMCQMCFYKLTQKRKSMMNKRRKLLGHSKWMKYKEYCIPSLLRSEMASLLCST
jgi:hypothetical protein